MRHALLILALAATLAACGPPKREVGEFSNDLLGNEIKIDALPDPEIPGVICHVAYFQRGVLDRATQGNWFEDPSNSAISCLRVGPIDLRRASLGKGGEQVFSDRQSLFFKAVAVRRIIDLNSRSIVYVSHGRELMRGSAKMGMSSVALTEDEVRAVGPRRLLEEQAPVKADAEK